MSLCEARTQFRGNQRRQRRQERFGRAHRLTLRPRDPAQVVADIHRGLPKGGLFISKTPCIGDRSVGLKRFLFRAMIPVMTLIGKAPSKVQFLTHAGMDELITDAGFEIVESGNFPAVSRYVVARKR